MGLSIFGYPSFSFLRVNFLQLDFTQHLLNIYKFLSCIKRGKKGINYMT